MFKMIVGINTLTVNIYNTTKYGVFKIIMKIHFCIVYNCEL